MRTIQDVIGDEVLPEVGYDFRYLSSGTRHALAIVTTLVVAPAGSLILVEEPEAFLHPSAQAVLLEFIRRTAEQKKLLVSTQSPLIAGACPREAVFLTTRDAVEGTRIKAVDEAGVEQVVAELGIRASFNFEADVYVFVEGENDVPVFEVWGRKFGFGPHVQFIDANGWTSMHYFANAKVIRSSRLQREVFVILDGDTGDRKNRSAKQELVRKLELPEGHVLTLAEREAEAYLLDAGAIVRAHRSIKVSEEQVRAKLQELSATREPKETLRSLFTELGSGPLDRQKAAAIAEHMALPEDVRQIFDRINATYRQASKS